MSQSLAVLSEAPVRMKEESAEKAESQIQQLLWPERVDVKLIDFESRSRDQILINESDPIVTNDLKKESR